MTETSPCVTMSRPPRDTDNPVGYRLSARRLNPLVEARLVADDGTVLPREGETVGKIDKKALRRTNAAEAPPESSGVPS